MPGGKASTTDNVTALAESLISLGSEVRQVRKARGMTLKALSKATGVSVSHLSAVERGAANPSLDIVYKLADALEISSD